MAWTDSRVFRQTVADMLGNTAAFDLSGTPDTFKHALFNNSITPDKDVAAAASAYDTGQWATANEVYEAGQWAQGGVALSNPAVTAPSSGTLMFDADDVASGASADLAGVYGGLTYDDTLAAPVADQGVCFNYYGGAVSVVAGTLTVIFSANGLFRSTM